MQQPVLSGVGMTVDFDCTQSYGDTEVVISPINLLTPNVNYSGRTAPLNSKVAFYIFIQQI